MTFSGPILVVEDDDDVRDAIVDTLSEADYEVAEAANGLEALTCLKDSSRLPCLIILDAMMPVMDGEEFLRQMRTDLRFIQIPVLLLTADGAAVKKAKSMEVVAGLKKPIELSELLAAVSTYRQAASAESSDPP